MRSLMYLYELITSPVLNYNVFIVLFIAGEFLLIIFFICLFLF